MTIKRKLSLFLLLFVMFFSTIACQKSKPKVNAKAVCIDTANKQGNVGGACAKYQIQGQGTVVNMSKSDCDAITAGLCGGGTTAKCIRDCNGSPGCDESGGGSYNDWNRFVCTKAN